MRLASKNIVTTKKGLPETCKERTRIHINCDPCEIHKQDNLNGQS